VDWFEAYYIYQVVEKFKLLYKSVDDIDLFIGLLGEWAVKGGLVGPVTSCIMADQFSRLRDGDRFFYENGGQPHSFTIGRCQVTFIQMSFEFNFFFNFQNNLTPFGR